MVFSLANGGKFILEVCLATYDFLFSIDCNSLLAFVSTSKQQWPRKAILIVTMGIQYLPTPIVRAPDGLNSWATITQERVHSLKVFFLMFLYYLFCFVLLGAWGWGLVYLNVEQKLAKRGEKIRCWPVFCLMLALPWSSIPVIYLLTLFMSSTFLITQPIIDW